ncbi:MAG: AAA family ATPase [Bryobacterales bacterium]
MGQNDLGGNHRTRARRQDRLHVRTRSPEKLDLTGALTAIEPRQVFFIDEIHRLLPDVEEMLYTALEDYRVDVMIAGPGARTHSIQIPGFTAIGATTRAGLISAPLRGRFRTDAAAEPTSRRSCAASCAARPGC